MPDPAEFRRFLLVCAEAPEDAGQVPGVLAAAGCSCDIVYRRGRTATVTFDPSRHRGLFILGDSADRASARCYDREREWARVAIARGLPVLGICHGAQLLADLHGGRLTAPSHLFLATVHQELRGEKTGADGVPGADGDVGSGEESVAVGSRWHAVA